MERMKPEQHINLITSSKVCSPAFIMNSNLSSIQKNDLRISALKRYHILDTPMEGSFDGITRLAATYLNVPIAIISLVDENRIWFKSNYGPQVQQTGCEPGFCTSAILSDDLYLVENALTDPRTLAHTWVTGSFGLRFYAAMPLTTYDGHNIGTLSVIDKRPRKLDEKEVLVLQDLRNTVMELLDLRLAARTAVLQQRNLLNMAVHDLKTPLTNISVRAQLIERKKDEPNAVAQLATQVRETSSKIITQVNDLLINSAKETIDPQLHYKEVDLGNKIRQVVAASYELAAYKNQQINMEIQEDPKIKVLGDEFQLSEIIDNLVSNAIKYCYHGGLIQVKLSQSSSAAIIGISDNGPGFSTADHRNIFKRFSHLSAKPTGGESSSGLGLSIVQQLVQTHGGRIRAEKKPAGEGAHLTVELPLIQHLPALKTVPSDIRLNADQLVIEVIDLMLNLGQYEFPLYDHDYQLGTITFTDIIKFLKHNYENNLLTHKFNYNMGSLMVLKSATYQFVI